jgi:hypothetical protein
MPAVKEAPKPTHHYPAWSCVESLKLAAAELGIVKGVTALIEANGGTGDDWYTLTFDAAESLLRSLRHVRDLDADPETLSVPDLIARERRMAAWLEEAR